MRGVTKKAKMPFYSVCMLSRQAVFICVSVINCVEQQPAVYVATTHRRVLLNPVISCNKDLEILAKTYLVTCNTRLYRVTHKKCSIHTRFRKRLASIVAVKCGHVQHFLISCVSIQSTICYAIDFRTLDVYSSSWNLRATERHLPYGITQCYLPPDTGERAPP